jgi:threonyl-tRNA synthetase
MVEDEVAELLSRTKKFTKLLAWKSKTFMLSTKPDEAMGTKDDWDNAEQALALGAKKSQMEI